MDSKENIMPVESLRLQSSENGHVYLDLSSRISWEDFPKYAANLLSRLGGCILRSFDSVDMRMLRVSIKGVQLDLVYQDFPQMVSLESDSCSGDVEIIIIEKDLRENPMAY